MYDGSTLRFRQGCLLRLPCPAHVETAAAGRPGRAPCQRATRRFRAVTCRFSQVGAAVVVSHVPRLGAEDTSTAPPWLPRCRWLMERLLPPPWKLQIGHTPSAASATGTGRLETTRRGGHDRAAARGRKPVSQPPRATPDAGRCRRRRPGSERTRVPRLLAYTTAYRLIECPAAPAPRCAGARAGRARPPVPRPSKPGPDPADPSRTDRHIGGRHARRARFTAGGRAPLAAIPFGDTAQPPAAGLPAV